MCMGNAFMKLNENPKSEQYTVYRKRVPTET